MAKDTLERQNRSILVKGAGEKATAVAHRLYRAGLKRILMTDLPNPRAERRGVSFCEAVTEGTKEVCGVTAQRVEPSLEGIEGCWGEGNIAVTVAPGSSFLPAWRPDILIDGVMAKGNTGTDIRDAPLVIALGPGFRAGRDCHFLVETNPGSRFLGRVLTEGEAEENTRIPTPVLGLRGERLLLAPAHGPLTLCRDIGDRVSVKETIGYVREHPLNSPLTGCIWGLVRNGLVVRKGEKIGDIDPRGDPELCFKMTLEARRIAHGVWRGIMEFGGR